MTKVSSTGAKFTTSTADIGGKVRPTGAKATISTAGIGGLCVRVLRDGVACFTMSSIKLNDMTIALSPSHHRCDYQDNKWKKDGVDYKCLDNKALYPSHVRTVNQAPPRAMLQPTNQPNN